MNWFFPALLLASTLWAQDRLIGELSGYYVNVVGLAYSPDGKRILSGDHYGVLKLWDAETRKLLLSWKGHPVEIAAVIFTQDGTKAVSASEGTTKLWDLKTGKLLSELKHGDWIRFLFLSPDNRTLAAVYYDEPLALWDIVKGKKFAVVREGKLEPADPSDTQYHQVRSRELRRLTVPDGIRNIPLDIPGKSPVEPGVKIDLTITAAFSPDGKFLLTGQWDYGLEVYDLEKMQRRTTWRGHTRPLTSVTFSSDGKRVLSGDRDGTIILRAFESGEELARFQGHAGDVYALAFSPDGKDVLAVTENFYFRRWDIATGETLASLAAYQRNMETVVFAPDRSRAISVNEEDTIKIWDTSTRTPTPTAALWTGNAKESLGRSLFFDRRLSGDDSFGCVMCHRPEKAFTDGAALSTGFSETLYFRNTPTLLNASRQKQLYWDARFPSEDMPSLVRDHMSEAHFMNVDGRLIQEKLRQTPDYVKAFREVYESEPTYIHVLDALSAFVASLTSAEAPFDRFQKGDPTAISPRAQRGYDLFRGEAGCIRCHNGTLFSDGQVHDRKVAQNPEIFASPLRHISFRRFFRILGVQAYANLREDVGHFAVSHTMSDRGKFRTPSLREVARTPPYMHNGMLTTLEDAVRHESPGLSRRDREDIVEFLGSLSSDTPHVEEPKLPPYTVRPKKDAPLRPSAPAGPANLAKPPPALAPLPPVPIPADNPLTPEKIALGKLLFFEERTSGNGHTSCAGCHIPLAGWGDLEKLSRNYTSTMHFRNTQTVLNAAYYTKLNWDGARDSLETQAHDAIISGIVGNSDPLMLEERLAQEPEYVKRFKDVFGTDRPHLDEVVKAIAAFIRSDVVSKNVPLDNYLRGDTAALSTSAIRGRDLFEGKAGCIRCHNGPLVSDQDFHATGVPAPPHFYKIPLLQITLRYVHSSRGVPEEIYRQADSDPGLYLVTKNEGDIGKFRTPSLRELKYTAPYMHNGIFDTLEEVLEFYNAGGGPTSNKSPLLKPLGLSTAEMKDLVSFLNSLSSPEVIDSVRPSTENMAYGASAHRD